MRTNALVMINDNARKKRFIIYEPSEKNRIVRLGYPELLCREKRVLEAAVVVSRLV